MNNQNSINLSVKDFQIIKSANISFLPGLNCIIGQSNNGKSALMRAAKACIYNESGTSSVRLGCNNFAVGLQMNGHTVILQKGNNSLYKIDNEVYGKIGRTQLDEVANALQIKELSINGSNETINFWDQMEKPFLLDRSETELFRFIVDSGKDTNVTAALKSITQDRQQISKDIVITQGKIAQIEDNIKRQELELQNSDKKLDIYNRVIELGPKISRVKELTNLKNKALDDGKQLSEVFSEKSRIDKVIDLSSQILEQINLNTRKLNLSIELSNKIRKSQDQIKNINTLLDKTKSLDISDLNDLFSKYKLLSSLVSKTRDTQDLIVELSNKTYKDININKDNLDKYKSLSEIIGRVNLKQSQIAMLENEKVIIDSELEKVNKELENIKICPTCGQLLHNN